WPEAGPGVLLAGVSGPADGVKAIGRPVNGGPTKGHGLAPVPSLSPSHPAAGREPRPVRRTLRSHLRNAHAARLRRGVGLGPHLAVLAHHFFGLGELALAGEGAAEAVERPAVVAPLGQVLAEDAFGVGVAAGG